MGARDKHGKSPPWGDEFSVVGKPARKVDGLSSQEAGAVLGKTDVAVRKLFSRAMARLATTIGGPTA